MTLLYMCIYIHICVYIHMCVYIYIYIHTCIYVYVYIVYKFTLSLNMLQYSVFSWPRACGPQSDWPLTRFFRSKTPRSSGDVCSEPEGSLPELRLLKSPQWQNRSRHRHDVNRVRCFLEEDSVQPISLHRGAAGRRGRRKIGFLTSNFQN